MTAKTGPENKAAPSPTDEALRVGLRVTVPLSHPWVGGTGTLIQPFNDGDVWLIEFDGGEYAGERHIVGRLHIQKENSCK